MKKKMDLLQALRVCAWISTVVLLLEFTIILVLSSMDYAPLAFRAEWIVVLVIPCCLCWLNVIVKGDRKFSWIVFGSMILPFIGLILTIIYIKDPSVEYSWWDKLLTIRLSQMLPECLLYLICIYVYIRVVLFQGSTKTRS